MSENIQSGQSTFMDRVKEALHNFGLPRMIIAAFLLLMFIIAPFTGANFWTQITNSEVTSNSDDAEGKWLDKGNGTWTYKMKVFDVPADYYIWEEPLPGFSCDLDNDTGYTVIHYPTEKNAVITNTRTTDDSCSLTLRKVLTGAVNDYPSEDFANRDYHFTVTLSGSGLAGNKVFGHTTFTDGVAHVTLRSIPLRAR